MASSKVPLNLVYCYTWLTYSAVKSSQFCDFVVKTQLVSNPCCGKAGTVRWEWSPRKPIVYTSATLFSSWVQSYLETCSNFNTAIPFLGSGTVRLSTLEPHRPVNPLRRYLAAALSLLLWEHSSPRRWNRCLQVLCKERRWCGPL